MKGKEFEADLIKSFDHYNQECNLTLIQKADPPVRLIRRRIQFQPSPWLDFTGSYGGKSIHIEAKERQSSHKEVDDDWLPLNRDDGLTEQQVEWMIRWGETGAISILLWRLVDHGTRLYNWTDIRDLSEVGIDRLHWERGIDCREMLTSQGLLLDPLKTYDVDFSLPSS